MSAVAAPSARRIAWIRRRRPLSRAWDEFRHHTPGMIGLGILVAAIVMALAAPLLADEAGLRAINTTPTPPSRTRRSSGRSARTAWVATS